MKIRIVIMLALVVVFTGCTSFQFGLSQADGLQIKIQSAPPTLYKIISYEKDGGPAFDLFHFQAEGAEEEPVGTGTVLRAEEEEGEPE